MTMEHEDHLDDEVGTGAQSAGGPGRNHPTTMKKIIATALLTLTLVGATTTAAHAGSRWSSEPVQVTAQGVAWK